MPSSDLAAVHRAGRLDRQAGIGYFSNPHLFADVQVNTSEQFAEWVWLCSAWSTGWLEADAGRTEHVANLMKVRVW